MAVAQLADPGEEARSGRFGRLRLEDHRRDAVRVGGEHLLDAVEVVVVELHGEGGVGGEDASRHRRGDDEPVVGGEEGVLATGRDHRPPRVGPGELEGRRGGVGAAEAELHHLGARDQLDHALGGVELEAVGTDEVDAVRDRPLDGLVHRGVGVAEGDRPQPAAVLDVLVAIDVPDPTAGAALDDRCHPAGILVLALGVGVGSAGNQLGGGLRMGDRGLEVPHDVCVLLRRSTFAGVRRSTRRGRSTQSNDCAADARKYTTLRGRNRPVGAPITTCPALPSRPGRDRWCPR